jgi:L-ascorbate metabolism protein UlaG (beta-lactamase superfamily)
MRMTKLGHSCVRIETEGGRIVVDPGAFSDDSALDGATAVLVTHEHFDHVVPEKLAAALRADPDLRVWTTPDLAGQLAEAGDRVHAVRHGDTFDVDGVEIQVYGEKHAAIHRDAPTFQNVGFRIGGAIFHPGDSFTVPEDRTPVVLAPAGGPWLRISELIDFLREAAPQQAYLIHDAVLSDIGRNVMQNSLGRLAGKPYVDEIIVWDSGKPVDLD